MDRVKRNKVLTIIYCTLRSIALLCVTGPIMQTFLASLGFPSQWIYINNGLVQAANMLTLSLCSRWTDKRNIIKSTVIAQVPPAILYLLYIPLCIWKSASLTSFAALTLISLLQTVCISLYTVCEYKMPYYLYPPKDYGTLISVIGLISSLISLGTGVLISWLITFMSYSDLMLVACVISAVLIVLSIIAHVLCKTIPQEEPVTATKQNDPPKTTALQLFRQPIFYKMIPANTLRGFAYGITTVMATIALDLGYDSGVATVLVAVQSFALLISNAIFAVGVSRIKLRLLVLIGCSPFLLIPLLFVRSSVIYLAVFAIIILGRNIVDNAVPSLLRFAVPVEIAAPYNAWRMMLHYAGTLMASLVATFLPPQAVLILTMAAQIAAGLSYFTTKEVGGRPLLSKRK